MPLKNEVLLLLFSIHLILFGFCIETKKMVDKFLKTCYNNLTLMRKDTLGEFLRVFNRTNLELIGMFYWTGQPIKKIDAARFL